MAFIYECFSTYKPSTNSVIVGGHIDVDNFDIVYGGTFQQLAEIQHEVEILNYIVDAESTEQAYKTITGKKFQHNISAVIKLLGGLDFT